MLDTYSDLIRAVQDRLTANGVSSFFNPDKIKRAIQMAYSEAQMLYMWPMLQKAKKVVGGTKANFYYYDYPPKLQTNSITRLILNGQPYAHIDFDDFLNWKYETPNKPSGEFKFANYGKQYFVDPTPTVAGLSIIVYGAENADPLVSLNDRTIFSDSEPLANEAIIKMAAGKLLPSANKKKEGQVEESEGVALLGTIYQKIQARKMNAQRLNKPMFIIRDYFGRGSKNSPIGNF